jgi:ribosomal protein S4
MTERKIILLTEVLETKVRKEKELEYYAKQLEELQRKMFFVKKEIDLTNLIIEIIENEKVMDIKEHLLEKKSLQSDENGV